MFRRVLLNQSEIYGQIKKNCDWSKMTWIFFKSWFSSFVNVLTWCSNGSPNPQSVLNNINVLTWCSNGSPNPQSVLNNIKLTHIIVMQITDHD